MPEGQVSHRNALRFTAALAGRELVRIEAPEPRLAPQRIPERLAGDRVRVVEAAGKHHLFRFESGRTLHSHLMMNGIWRVTHVSNPPRRGNLWVALWTDEHVVAEYRGPMMKLLEPGEAIPQVDALGPDLLDSADPARDTVERLRRVARDREVGDALMDQRVVAGIGNVYKSETCFLCGVDPWRPVGSLTDEESRALGATASRLMIEGVNTPGRIQTYRPPGGTPFGRQTKWVYGRRGKPCRRCGTLIRSRGQGDANRTTYWCPTCQR